jgi:hypothetical protein
MPRSVQSEDGDGLNSSPSTIEVRSRNFVLSVNSDRLSFLISQLLLFRLLESFGHNHHDLMTTLLETLQFEKKTLFIVICLQAIIHLLDFPVSVSVPRQRIPFQRSEGAKKISVRVHNHRQKVGGPLHRK